LILSRAPFWSSGPASSPPGLLRAQAEERHSRPGRDRHQESPLPTKAPCLHSPRPPSTAQSTTPLRARFDCGSSKLAVHTTIMGCRLASTKGSVEHTQKARIIMTISGINTAVEQAQDHQATTAPRLRWSRESPPLRHGEWGRRPTEVRPKRDPRRSTSSTSATASSSRLTPTASSPPSAASNRTTRPDRTYPTSRPRSSLSPRSTASPGHHRDDPLTGTYDLRSQGRVCPPAPPDISSSLNATISMKIERMLPLEPYALTRTKHG